MKLIVRIFAITLVAAAALVGGSASANSAVASNMPSSVPGGGPPGPTCNPFTTNCPPMR
jgi:hypothetical protein